MIDEGYIKYKIKWDKKQVIHFKEIEGLNKARKVIYSQNWLGYCAKQKVGYGNISCRRVLGQNQFIISGTQTGNVKELNETEYSLVLTCKINENAVHCVGLTKASSEALTHSIIYQHKEKCNAVIHIHEKQLWEYLSDRVETTPPNISYGTVEMAKAIEYILQNNDTASGVIVMLGHEDGILAYGENLDQVISILEKHESERILKKK